MQAVGCTGAAFQKTASAHSDLYLKPGGDCSELRAWLVPGTATPRAVPWKLDCPG